MLKHKQYSPMLASNFEQKGQEKTTSYNLPYWPCYHGRNVRVKGEQCNGGKHAKDRITIVLCANMAGEIRKI